MKNNAAAKINEGLISRGAAALNRGVKGATSGAKAGALGGAALGAMGSGIPGAITGALGGAAAGGLGGGIINAVAGKDDEGVAEIVINGKKVLIPASRANELLANYGGDENAEDSYVGKLASTYGKMASGGAKGFMKPLNPAVGAVPGGSALARATNALAGVRDAVPGAVPTTQGAVTSALNKAGNFVGNAAQKNLTNLGSNVAQGASNLGSNIAQGAGNVGSAISQGAGSVGNALKGMAAAAPGGPAGAALIGAGLLGAGALGANMLRKKRSAEAEETDMNDEENQTQVKEGIIGGAFKGAGKGALGGATALGTLGAIGGAGLAAATNLPIGAGALAGGLGGAKTGAVLGGTIGAPVGAVTDDDEEGAATHNVVVTGANGEVEGSLSVTPHELEMLLNLVKSRQRKDTKVSLAKSLNDDEEVKAELSPKQKKIAAMAPPHDEITGADFAAMKKVKKENTDIKAFIKSISQKNYADANKYLKDIVDSKIKSKIESVRNEKLF